MKTEATIQRQGNSICVVLPQTILHETGFAGGQTVSLQTTPEGLLIKAQRKGYSAAELNAQCNPNAAMPDDLAEWENMPAIGLEVL